MWGELTLFNASDAYADGIVRGYKGGLLREEDYEPLCQSPSMDDYRMHLQGTDYGNFLANEPPNPSPAAVQDRATDLMVQEFEYLRGNAGDTLAQFLDYIRHPYMIDNVILVIQGTLHDRPLAELLEKCHPLGRFDDLGAAALASNVDELYHHVLVDTPVGKYFSKECFQVEDMHETELDVVRNLLMKAYLEDFLNFCQNEIGGTTAEVMTSILEFEADRRAINISLNALGSELTKDDVRKLYPECGLLFPFGHVALNEMSDRDQFSKLLEQPLKDYAHVLEGTSVDQEGSIEEAFSKAEIELHKASFDQQFHYGVFYSYFALKEREIRNLTLIAECIAQEQRGRIHNYYPIY